MHFSSLVLLTRTNWKKMHVSAPPPPPPPFLKRLTGNGRPSGFLPIYVNMQVEGGGTR